MNSRYSTLSLFALVLALGALAPTLARADALDDRLSAAKLTAIGGIEEIAVWAVDHRLIGGRHRALRRILYLAPDHPAARASLEFTRTKKGGPWIQSKTYREPADWNKDALPEYDRKIMAVLTTYRNDAMVAIEEAGDAAGARRGRVFDQLLALLPDDEVVRKAHGDVRLAGGWVMVETVRAIDRRREFLALAREAVGGVEPPVVDAAHVAKGWSVALRTADVLCLGTHEARTCVRTIQLCQAFPQFLGAVFGRPVGPAGPPAIFLLKSRAEAADVFRSNGDVQEWARLEAAGVAGGWLTRSRGLVVWRQDGTDAFEAAVRQSIDSVMHRLFHCGERGWITEGIGRALSFAFAGIYGPPFVTVEQTHGKGDDVDAFELPTGNWMVAARDALRALPSRRLSALLTLRLSAMGPLDAVVAYALGTYLIEGRPDVAAAFIDASIASDDAEKVVTSVLGVSVDELLDRLRNFTVEVTTPR